MVAISRRRALQGSLAALSAAAWQQTSFGTNYFRSNDFDDDCGVASGDPTSTSVVIWTRVPSRFQGLAAAIEVSFAVALQSDFRAGSIVATGTLTAASVDDYTVHHIVEGLEAWTEYYYRFSTASGYQSIIGRMKTLPDEHTDLLQLRIATMSCQRYSEGYYTALTHLAREEIDFVCHLGDHVYEADVGTTRRVDHLFPRESRTLADYRAKHRLYLSDPAARAVRQQFTTIHMWDDHEVYNDYAGAVDIARDVPRFAAAYQAYCEYLPIIARVSTTSAGLPTVQVYRRFSLGRLADVIVTDGRQYRQANPCTSTYMAPSCRAMEDGARTMLGSAQASWLEGSLGESRARWKIVLTAVVYAPMKTAANIYLNLDAWDGFPAERQRLSTFIHDEQIENVLFLSGDIHSSIVANIHLDVDDVRSPVIAAEFTTPAVSSQSVFDMLGPAAETALNSLLTVANPHLRWFDVRWHGYTIVTLTEHSARASHFHVQSVRRPTSDIRRANSMVVPARSR